MVQGHPPKAPPMTPAGGSTAGMRTPQELVARLSSLDLSGGTLSQEVADHWQESFEQLIRQGPAAVPAIRGFLGTFTDTTFGPAGLRKLGYASARTLFDARVWSS